MKRAPAIRSVSPLTRILNLCFNRSHKRWKLLRSPGYEIWLAMRSIAYMSERHHETQSAQCTL